MGKERITALLIAIGIVGLALMRTASASHDADHVAFSGGAEVKGSVVKTDQSITSVSAVSPSWQTVDSRGFQIPAGESQLVVVDFFATTHCSGSAGFCSVRVLGGRTLATAHRLEPAAGGIIESVGSGFHGHAAGRALCLRNATASPVDISVWLQANRSSSGVTSFQLNDWMLKIARNAPCSPFVNI